MKTSTDKLSTRAGFVTIIGLPNAGKSTLVNLIFEQKLAIVSPKVQTTRFALNTIYTEENLQIVFIDTPGIILKSTYLMHEKMMHQLDKATKDADVFIFMLDISKFDNSFPEILAPWIKKQKPHITLLNKADKATKTKINDKTAWLKEKGFQNILPFTATLPKEKKKLLDVITPLLPVMPFYYEDGNQLSDRSMRFFCSEFIREQLYYLLREELPYESAVMVHQFQEKENVTVIYADIIVSKESQKMIVIGEKGSVINAIGTKARQSIEAFLDKRVYLDLRVKVREGWKKKNHFLKSYGFNS